MPVRVGQRGLRRAALVVALVLARSAGAGSLVDGLATDDPQALAAAVGAIERAAPSSDNADALFGAARACEDRLLDPARALALYERLLREAPDARVAAAAERRAAALRGQLGEHGEHAREGAELAKLIALADALEVGELARRGDALAASDWPGAADAVLWLADVLRRRGAYELAQQRYDAIAARWPARAVAALRGGAGNAIDAGDWARATALVQKLPAAEPADKVVRDELFDEIAVGRRRARSFHAAWILLILAVAGLLASLGEAIARGGRRWPKLRPPAEVMFLAPFAVLLTAIAYGARAVVAPAVAEISVAGVVTTWISGAALDLLRARGRGVRARAIAQVIACAVVAICVGYLAIVAGGLVELLGETIQAGPG